jgi:hypothetical protein
MRTLLFTALAAASFTAVATQPLLPAGSNDQVPLRVVSLPAPTGQFERAPVAFSWALDPAAALAEPAPHLAESREYWLTVDAAELGRGVDIDLSAPGALIRVSPGRGARKLASTDLQLAGNGRAARLERTASDAELQAAGMDVEAGTVMVRVGRENARGRYTLRIPNASGRYVVHVFEPESAVVLKARADRNHAVVGETVTVDIALSDAGSNIAATADALLVAPDGNSQPVAVTRGRDGRLSASVRLPAMAAATTPGLWELQVFASGAGVQRDARTAFAVAQPTARFKGDYAFNTQLLRVAMPVEAGSPGRYEARGTLYASGPDRVLHPVAQAHVASWFEPGDGMLVLDFDRKHLPAGYGAPFEVRQLELHDQTRMAPLEVRGRGARF